MTVFGPLQGDMTGTLPRKNCGFDCTLCFAGSLETMLWNLNAHSRNIS